MWLACYSSYYPMNLHYSGFQSRFMVFRNRAELYSIHRGRPWSRGLNRWFVTTLPLTAWVRVPVGAKTFMWGGLPADLRCVGGSTHTCEYSCVWGLPPPVKAGSRHMTLKVSVRLKTQKTNKQSESWSSGSAVKQRFNLWIITQISVTLFLVPGMSNKFHSL
jgi:hypothetical protein